MSTTSSGREAESAVSEHLASQGHEILSQNWRTRWCEIDIVSKKKNCVYFTEVKFRKSSEWGSGFEYIIAKKLHQMNFAAEFWIAEHGWKGDVVLLAAEVSGEGTITVVEI